MKKGWIISAIAFTAAIIGALIAVALYMKNKMNKQEEIDFFDEDYTDDDFFFDEFDEDFDFEQDGIGEDGFSAPDMTADDYLKMAGVSDEEVALDDLQAQAENEALESDDKATIANL